jgi:hypothetical protein
VARRAVRRSGPAALAGLTPSAWTTYPAAWRCWTRLQLVGRERLNDRVVAVTDLGVRDEGRVAAAAQLRIDGATAAVESVLTDEAFCGQEYRAAVLARALGPAETAGCDLGVIEAAADDWPWHWYAR